MYRPITAKVFRLLTSPEPVLFNSRQISSWLLSAGKMSSGKDSTSEDSSPSAGGAGIRSRPSPDHIDRRECKCAPETSNNSLGFNRGSFGKRRSRIDLRSEQRTGDSNSSKCQKNIRARVERSKSGQSYCKHAASANHVKAFDICLPSSSDSAGLKSLLEMEEFQENVEDPIEETRQGVLQPGMVLLKHYISLNDQIEIVKSCRELGLGPGGFYTPGYKYGAKLRLQMMCLGLNWDPETRKYEDRRPIDGCKPPSIPHEFNQLVETAIQDAHALIRKDIPLSNVEDMLPAMSPDICIVNFYTTSGRLGLHQDRDESRDSLDKGLPVVSFSVGDSAEFLYGNQRDVNKADNIVLESGDVLIFGGKSRHVFHGVTSIIPNSAPKALIEETGLRPGRLNLTFRRY